MTAKRWGMAGVVLVIVLVYSWLVFRNDLEVPVRRRASVQRATLSGRLYKPDLEPLDSGRVYVRSLQGELLTTIQVDEKGTYQSGDVTAGTFLLTSEHQVWGSLNKKVLIVAGTNSLDWVYQGSSQICVTIDYLHDELPTDALDVNVLRINLVRLSDERVIVQDGKRVEQALFEGLWPGNYLVCAETATTVFQKPVEIEFNNEKHSVSIEATSWDTIEEEVSLEITVDHLPYTGPIRFIVEYPAGVLQENRSVLVSHEFADDGIVEMSMNRRLVAGCVLEIANVRGFAASRKVVDKAALKRSVHQFNFVSVSNAEARVAINAIAASNATVLIDDISRVTNPDGFVSLAGFEAVNEIDASLQYLEYSTENGLVEKTQDQHVVVDSSVGTATEVQFEVPGSWLQLRLTTEEAGYQYAKVFVRYLDVEWPKWSKAVLLDPQGGFAITGLPAKGRIEVFASCWADCRRWMHQLSKTEERFIDFAPLVGQRVLNVEEYTEGEEIEIRLQRPLFAGRIPAIVREDGRPVRWCYVAIDSRNVSGPGEEIPWETNEQESLSSHCERLVYEEFFGERFARFYAFSPKEYLVVSSDGIASLDRKQIGAAAAIVVKHERTITIRPQPFTPLRGELHCKSGLVVRARLGNDVIAASLPDELVFSIPLHDAPEFLQVHLEGAGSYSYSTPQTGDRLTVTQEGIRKAD